MYKRQAIASAVRLANLRSTASFDGNTIQFTTLPGGTIIDGWFVGVWSGSKHKEEAGKFVEKMYSPESDMKWIELGGQAPCRKSTVESLEITDENKYMEAMIKAFGAVSYTHLRNQREALNFKATLYINVSYVM